MLDFISEEGLPAKFERWSQIVVELHEEFVHASNEFIHWTLLPKPLKESRVALVSTAGVHKQAQPAFDMESPLGDWSYRIIEGDVDSAELMVTHDHYNHEHADRDINCVFPIDRLRELALSHDIGEVSPVHMGLMGFAPNPGMLISHAAPEITRLLKEVATTLVVLTPG